MSQAQIILASQSPRRQELLRQIGIHYRLRPVDLDETPIPGEAPDGYVLRMAREKAETARQNSGGTLPVLAADTSVVLEGRIMGKPVDKVDGLAMLKRLSGKTHQVYSAVCLHTGQCQLALSITDVSFRPLLYEEIVAYWNSGEPVDKAGAYAIQGLAALFVETIKGSYSGVVGLPLFETGKLLQAAGIVIVEKLPVNKCR